MRLIKVGRDKRGLSEIVSYVLLIFIAFSVATLIFVLLKDMFKDKETETCPTEGVSISIKEAECELNLAPTPDKITITIRNTGLFNIDALFVKGNNNPNVDDWRKLDRDPTTPLSDVDEFYQINDADSTLTPNEESTYAFISTGEITDFSNLNKVFIGGAKRIGNDWSVCENAYAIQEVTCT